MYTLNLPNNLDKVNMNSLMINIIDGNKKPLYDHIILNFSTLNFIRPAGVVTLDNIISWLNKRGVRVEFSYYQEDTLNDRNAIKYLDDSGFFKKYLKTSLTDNARLRATTIPLENITYEGSYAWVDNNFIPWLANSLNVKRSTLANIATCLGEIFNNIKDHSYENTACLFAQHFPKEKKLTFCISDFGVGIPVNVRKLKPELSDKDALAQAIIDGFTTKTSPRNLGAGLHTMIVNVVHNLRGTVHIYSGYGILTAQFDHYCNKMVVSTCESEGFYPGTFLEFNINTEIVLEEDALNEEEEFVW